MHDAKKMSMERRFAILFTIGWAGERMEGICRDARKIFLSKNLGSDEAFQSLIDDIDDMVGNIQESMGGSK